MTYRPRKSVSWALSATGPTAARMPSLRAKLRRRPGQEQKQAPDQPRPTKRGRGLDLETSVWQHKGGDETHRGKGHNEHAEAGKASQSMGCNSYTIDVACARGLFDP